MNASYELARGVLSFAISRRDENGRPVRVATLGLDEARAWLAAIEDAIEADHVPVVSEFGPLSGNELRSLRTTLENEIARGEDALHRSGVRKAETRRRQRAAGWR